MSLEIVQRNRFGSGPKMTAEFSCQVPGCVAGVRHKGRYKGQDPMRSAATCDVFIAGRPVGSLCGGCAKVWRKAWDAALAGFAEEAA